MFYIILDFNEEFFPIIFLAARKSKRLGNLPPPLTGVNIITFFRLLNLSETAIAEKNVYT